MERKDVDREALTFLAFNQVYNQIKLR